jgi:hypothetical protein
MKAICVKNSIEKSHHSKFEYLNGGGIIKYDLTIGKVYEISMLSELAPNILPKKCIVIDDFRKYIHAPYELFKPIEEFRNEQIDEILK